MTTDQPHERPVNRAVPNALTAIALTVLAGMAVTEIGHLTHTPNLVPYTAAGIMSVWAVTALVGVVRRRRSEQ